MSLDAPLRFRPHLRAMVWGGRRLADRLGRTLPTAEAFGESWEISDHPLHQSVVDEGPHLGRTLRDLMRTDRDDLLGPAGRRFDVFPWLVKFLDCHDWLSVQVHPNRETVGRLRPGEGSKTEAWFILDVQPGGRVYAGWKPGVDEPALRQALERGVVHELLASFEPRPGDCVFLPAGTVHAVGGGVLMAEIQETSDVTFRLFDWNRVDAEGKRRPLHIDESLASIDWTRGAVEPVRSPQGPLVRCDEFHLDAVEVTSPRPLAPDRMHVVVVVAGSGRWDDGRTISVGDSWLVPARASVRTMTPSPRLRILDAVLPD